MLAAVTRSPGEMVLDDVPAPGPAGPGQVIVRPEVVGICGSDLHLFSGDIRALSGAAMRYPRIQGHELCAVVEDIGAGCPPGLRQGDRVAVWPLLPCGRCYPCLTGRPNACVSLELVGVHLDGGLQQRLAVPASQVFQVGDLDPAHAAFVEPMSIAVHALGRGGLYPEGTGGTGDLGDHPPGPAPGGRQLTVFGAGPIGLATVIAATAAGARAMVIDPVADRRKLATRVGADHVCWGTRDGLREAAREWSGGGPPLIVDTTGDPGVLPQAAEMVCATGRIVVVGMSAATAAMRSGIFPEKEIDVVGSSCATAEDFARAVRLAGAHAGAVAALLSHRFPLTRANEAIELARSRPAEVVKVLITI